MKIFIIGGAGYIGSHMVKAAYKARHEVVTIDNLSTGHKNSVLYGKFELCDILDPERLSLLFNKHRPEIVVHFGAYSIVSESVTDPYKYYHNNVTGTLNVLKAMIDNNCKKIIFSSTAAVFGSPEYTPIDEAHPKKPINPYGRTKLMVEDILKDFDVSYGIKYVTFRYFNAAGHDPESGLSERHNPETHLLPIVMQAANAQRDAVHIYGSDYDTHDGSCIRDYIHVNDLASAHLKGMEYLNTTQPKSVELNLGNGDGFSVIEIIDKVKEITNKSFLVVRDARRKGDPSVLISSNNKAKEVLNFSPEYKDIDSIIKTLIGGA